MADWEERFEPLEVLQKNSWRKGYSGGESKMFSRLSQVVKGVRSCQQMHEEPSDAISHLDVHFQELACSIPKMVDWLQQNGHLSKLQRKTRGGPAANE